MATPNEYIVFEPDQVLTNEHLNETFNYLDQQERWTRNKLIGIGIVCGLDIVQHTGVIEITKGCGVTSQGYLIVQDTRQYTYYTAYVAADQPNDLPFTYPGKLPFYKPYAEDKTISLLLTDDQYNALDSGQQANAHTLSSMQPGLLDNYVVVLFLEAREMDLKNCDTLDCNNKGEKMAFNVRPLLVLKKDIASLLHPSPHRKKVGIKLKRYNVPYRNLNNSDDVLNAFLRITDDDVLIAIAAAYNYCYQAYHFIWQERPNPFFELFQKLRDFRDAISSTNGFLIQYFYDFINDLINAYYEFISRASQIECACCPDENLFPLHLVLGGADQNTGEVVRDSYRRYFIPSCVSGCRHKSTHEIHLLFQRMEKMIDEFFIPYSKQIAGAFFSSVAFLKNQGVINLKITPSQYESFALSQRAIPYYYLRANQFSEGATPIQYDMHLFWNYKKTVAGNATLNLGYHSHFYSNDDAVVNPLFYDIEPYNFFRIEGHIGINYRVVLKNLLEQRRLFNLPFDVVAVSAELLNTDSASLPDCNLLDLETEYRLIISEFVCKVQKFFCLFILLPYSPTEGGVSGLVQTILKNESTVSTSPEFVAFEATIYQKGDFMKNQCARTPDPKSVGLKYLQSLDSNGIFTNPVTPELLSNQHNQLLYYLLEYIDAIEELMFIFKTNSLSSLDTSPNSRFIVSYNKYTTTINHLIKLMSAVGENNPGALIAYFEMLLYICMDEKIKTLKAEYLIRLRNHQQQLSFLNYFRQHPGLEHKGGVPKGGTFVIAYHQQRPTIPIDTTNNAGHVPLSLRFNALQIKQITDFVNNCNDPAAGDKTEIIQILNPPSRIPKQYQLDDGIVIADFYVPYLCCSDCPPVTYVLSKEPDPVPADKPEIKMGTTFCDFEEPQPIEVSKPGGTFANENGDKIEGLDESGLTFAPAIAGKGVYTIIYTVDGVASDPVTVTVLATPENSKFSFTSQPQADSTFLVTFKPDITGAGSYAWKFGPGFQPDSSTLPSPAITATFSPTGGQIQTSATLVVSNGKCRAKPVRKILRISPNGVDEPGIPAPTHPSEVEVVPAKKAGAKSKKDNGKKASAVKKGRGKK